MGVEQGQIGKTEGMAEVNKNQDPGADSLSAARPYRPLSLRARLILLLFVIAIPLTGMALGFQKMIASYSASYLFFKFFADHTASFFAKGNSI